MRPLHIAMIFTGLLLLGVLLYDVYNGRKTATRSVFQLKSLPDLKPDAYLYLGVFSLHLASRKR